MKGQLVEVSEAYSNQSDLLAELERAVRDLGKPRQTRRGSRSAAGPIGLPRSVGGWLTGWERTESRHCWSGTGYGVGTWLTLDRELGAVSA
jgi:hypothetical protein